MSRSFPTKPLVPTAGRVWAPFRGKAGSASLKDIDRRESWYCHGYRQSGEHYHKSFDELLDCGLMGDEPHLRDLRAARALTLSKREGAST